MNKKLYNYIDNTNNNTKPFLPFQTPKTVQCTDCTYRVSQLTRQ